MSTPSSPASTIGEHHLSRLADAHLERVGDGPTLFFEGTWHHTADLHGRAQRVAGGLRGLGVEAGDRIVVLMTNTPEVSMTYHAAWRAGAVVTPVLFLISPVELRHILTDSGAKAVVVTPELLTLLAAATEDLDLSVVVVGADPTVALPPGATSYADLETADPLPTTPRADDDLAALLYTGGTTGRAKGVMLSHLALWSGGRALYSVSAESGTTRMLLPLPLSHVFGLGVTVAGLHADGPRTSVLQRWFDAPSWVTLAEEHRIESSSVVPSMLTMLLAQPLEEHDLSSLVSFGCGGAPLPPAVREEVERRLGVEVHEGYGCTESSASATANRRGANRPGTVGRPLPGLEVEIQDPSGQAVPAGTDGEVCLRGPSLMQGYWRAEEQTAATLRDGWLHTGDIGHLDEDGYLSIVDRMKDLIIRGGFNVYPRDVEDALLEHPDITAAAVVGRPDDAHGEEVVAVIAVRPGSTLTEDEVVAWSRERLTRYKYPREVRILEAVPLTSVGKTDRKAVRALLA